MAEYPLDDKSNWYGDANYKETGGQLVSMHPDEFLSKARPMEIDELARENIDDLKNHIKSGRKLDPLALYPNGKEDGRHRAHAARELGIKKVPVLIWPKTHKDKGGSVDDGITAYHGSPYEFDQFDTSKIGTGEGAQAYGHGLYFAEAEPVAEEYRENTTRSKNIRDFTKHRISGLNAEDFEPQMKGHMYEVQINAHPDHFLDWDKPLRDQPEIIRRLSGWSPEHEKIHREAESADANNLMAALEGDVDYAPAKMPRRPQGALPMSATGEDIYEHFKNKMGAVDWPIDADAETRAKYRGSAAEKASQYLASHGIKGIKYLDQQSRSQGKGSRNYVVFDHNDVNIKRKYEQGGAVEYPLADGEDHLEKMPPQEFLDRSRPLKDTPEDKKLVKDFKKDIESGNKLDPLALYKSGKENGRHRATAAKELGVKKVPVHDYRKRNGGAIVDRALMIISKKA